MEAMVTWSATERKLGGMLPKRRDGDPNHPKQRRRWPLSGNEFLCCTGFGRGNVERIHASQTCLLCFGIGLSNQPWRYLYHCHH